MSSLYHPETTKHVVCHDNDKIFSYNVVEPQNCFDSGLPFMEVFNSEEEVREAFPQIFETPEIKIEETEEN